MPKRYFDVLDDLYLKGRWELGAVVGEDGEVLVPWLVMRGEPAHFAGRLKVDVQAAGAPLDFTFAAFDVPVVNARVAAILTELAPGELQLIPVEVAGKSEPYFILNTLRVVKCIDDQACRAVQYWSEEDGQPERIGEYSSVSGMRIAPEKVGNAGVFRPWGWRVALLVSEHIKDALEQAGVTGVKFEDVTGPGSKTSEEQMPSPKYRELLKQMDAAREQAYSQLGQLEPGALVPIVPYGPLWPGHRRAWRIIHREKGRTLLATDGLSDPFLDKEEPSTGFGLELVIETGEPMEKVPGSWQLRLLESVADEVVEYANIRTWLLKGLASMEVSGEDMPATLVTKEGRVGVLLGVETSSLPRRIPTPAGEVVLVTLKALLPVELDFMLRQGRGGPAELARRFAAQGSDAHLSQSFRKPVV